MTSIGWPGPYGMTSSIVSKTGLDQNIIRGCLAPRFGMASPAYGVIACEDYRIVCQIRNETLTVLVVGVGHRRDVYR
jgi:hypothetical protein